MCKARTSCTMSLNHHEMASGDMTEGEWKRGDKNNKKKKRKKNNKVPGSTRYVIRWKKRRRLRNELRARFEGDKLILRIKT